MRASGLEKSTFLGILSGFRAVTIFNRRYFSYKALERKNTHIRELLRPDVIHAVQERCMFWVLAQFCLRGKDRFFRKYKVSQNVSSFASFWFGGMQECNYLTGKHAGSCSTEKSTFLVNFKRFLSSRDIFVWGTSAKKYAYWWASRVGNNLWPQKIRKWNFHFSPTFF